MHRLILGLEAGDPLQADHINRDRLDNRRANLRAVTASQNRHNQGSRPGSSSTHRGVSWSEKRGRWEASVNVNGRAHFLGRFADELDAARVASEFRREHMPFSEADQAAPSVHRLRSEAA